MLYRLPQIIVFLGHTTILVLAYFSGAWMNKKNNPSHDSAFKRPGTMVIEGTLLSFLLGFTFNAAFDKSLSRKNIFSEEINDISTVYSIAGLYPDSISQKFNKELNQYVEYRIAYFDAGTDEVNIRQELEKADSVSNNLLGLLSIYGRDKNFDVFSKEMIPAMNKMFDTSATREMLRTSRVPLPSLRLLLLISIVVSFLSGLNGGFEKQDWFTAVGFSLLVSMTLYLILDLDSSRIGFITLADQQQRLIKLYRTFR